MLPDGMNLNQELVKQGWCWWYRKYASGDTVLERLENEAREGRKVRVVGRSVAGIAVGVATIEAIPLAGCGKTRVE